MAAMSPETGGDVRRSRSPTRDRESGEGSKKGKAPIVEDEESFGYLDNDDLNGECFISGELGEVETMQLSRLVVVGSEFANNIGERVHFSARGARLFLQRNFELAYCTDTSLSLSDAAKVAYLRFLAVRLGHISPVFDTAANNVKYRECIGYDELNPALFLRNISADDVASTFLTKNVRDILRVNYVNIVGCVAYMFRVRGHHWLPDMDEKYRDLWGKCLKGSENPGLKWQYVAHNALHAIYPKILDDIWVVSVREGNVAGALVKRIDAAPAGVAAIKAVYAGAQDLQMAVPGIQMRFQEHFVELEVLIEKLRANRWAGSINRKFYNADNLNFNEQKFGAIAAVVRAALETFAPDSPLIRSPALRRVSGNARLTGGIVTRGIATAATDPNLVKRILNIKGGAEDKDAA